MVRLTTFRKVIRTVIIVICFYTLYVTYAFFTSSHSNASLNVIGKNEKSSEEGPFVDIGDPNREQQQVEPKPMRQIHININEHQQSVHSSRSSSSSSFSSSMINFQIENRRTVPFCSKKSLGRELSMPISALQNTFQLVLPPNLIYIYSAYHLIDTNLIRIIGFKSSSWNGKLFCQIWYRNDPNVMLVLPAHPLAYPEGAGRVYVAGEFRCDLSSSQVHLNNKEQPYAVSLATSECEHTLNTLPLIVISSATAAAPAGGVEENKKNAKFAAICVAPLNLHYDHIDQFVEWIEVNKILGAKQVYLYNHTVGKRVRKAIEQYMKENFITLLQWNVPVKVHIWPIPPGYVEDIKYYAQMAQINDCILRSRADGYTFTVISDLDEILFPRKELKWYNLLSTNSRPSGSFASLTFRNTFFKTEWPSDAEMMKNETIVKLNLTTLLKTRREMTILPPGSRSKLIVLPQYVAVMGVHNVWEYLPNSPSAAVLSPEEGLVHHYRNWEGMGEQTFVEDRSIHRLSDEIISSVRQRKLTLT